MFSGVFSLPDTVAETQNGEMSYNYPCSEICSRGRKRERNIIFGIVSPNQETYKALEITCRLYPALIYINQLNIETSSFLLGRVQGSTEKQLVFLLLCAGNSTI